MHINRDLLKFCAARRALAAAVLATGMVCGFARAEVLVKPGDVVGIVGDSITEQKVYSVFIEDYMLMCQPVDVRAINFGWSGEQVSGLNQRIKDVLTLKPTVVTTCYGMNDGHYTQVTDDIRRTYREQSRAMVDTFLKHGVRVVVGSPGVVDPGSYKHEPYNADVYNINLGCLRAEAKYVAESSGQTFADVHTPMMEVMKRLKAKYGQDVLLAGNDGVHPGPNGQLVMAYAFLKALGFDGDIGTFTVDLAAHTAAVSEGHKLVKFEGNTLTIESTRYPFCFFGKYGGDQGSSLAPTEFLPFNRDLNRLTLKVTGPATKYRITWGKNSKIYSSAELKTGINLAAEWTDNPFCDTFFAVSGQVVKKQTAETELIKNLLHAVSASSKYLPDDQDAIDRLTDAIKRRDVSLASETRAWIKPLTHLITIEAANEGQ